MHALEVPLIIFLAIVAPVWIVFHYVFRDKKGHKKSSSDDREKVEELLTLADKMESRIVTLESILDKEHPNWRSEV